MRNKIKWRRPSPAMIIALLALFVAFGGTVYAGTKISGKTIRKNSEPGNRIKKDTVTGKQVKESTLGVVPLATSATSATSASSANPIAFAQVSATGAVNAANSKGVVQANVTNNGTGIKCFSGLSFTPKGGVATVDYNQSSDGEVAQFGLGVSGGCAPGTQAFVYTEDTGSNLPENDGFFVLFYN
jgi:hypothetical protein